MQQMKNFPGNDNHLNNSPKVAELETGSWKLREQWGIWRLDTGDSRTESAVCTQVALCLVGKWKHKCKSYVTWTLSPLKVPTTQENERGCLEGNWSFLLFP